jgi:hypothetical protein
LGSEEHTVKRGLVTVMVCMAVFVGVVLWLYVQFLVPRMQASTAAKVALPIVFVFLVFLPYLGAWRGNTLETRTESQHQWAHGFKYWVFLVFLVIAPFSIRAAGIVSAAIVVAALTYAYLWRPKAQP